MIKSVVKMKGEYVFFSDMDESPCLRAKKDKLTRIYKELDQKRIVVINPEIESWYLAGLDKKARQKLGLGSQPPAVKITKEKLNSMIPPNVTRVEFMNRMLEHFSVEEGEKNSPSLAYFVRNFDC